MQSFKDASQDDIFNIQFVGGESSFALNTNERNRIISLQRASILDINLSPSQNLIKIIATDFLNTQIQSVQQLTMQSLNCNPILVTALKLDTSEKLLRYSVYQSASRSIVTSFGYFVQKLLLYSGENIYDAKDEPSFHGTKWDLVKRLEDVKSWIEVKSGPNDLNKTQILSYQSAIQQVEASGAKAYIGETYGTRAMETITHNLYKQYLNNWEQRTLIGRELWDFVSDDPDYHSKLISLLRDVANTVLNERSVIEHIEMKIETLVTEFNQLYSAVDDFIDTLW